MMYEPMVAILFWLSQPWFASYVHVRRGMPFSPRKCMGKNVRFMPMNVTQNWMLPSFSLMMRPVIFG